MIDIHSNNSRVMVMVFNTTFNYISVISWRSVILIEETGEHHRPDKLFWIMLYRVHITMSGIGMHRLVVIGTDCIGSCKSKNRTLMTTTTPK